MPIDNSVQTTIDGALRTDRQRISTLLNTLHNCFPKGTTYETRNQVKPLPLAAECFMRASMWLGQALKKLGEPTPYPKSSDPTSPVIEPTADINEYAFPHDPSDRISTIKLIRQQTDDLLEYVSTRGYSTEQPSLIAHEVGQATTSLIDAKMWLGQEPALIREKE